MEDLKLPEEIFTKWSKICHHFDNAPCEACPLDDFCGTGIRCDYAKGHVDTLIDTIRQSAELLEVHTETQPVTPEVIIHIRGMNMPSDCNNCPFFDDDGDYPTCRVTSHSRGYNWNPRGQRMPDCPLHDTIKGEWHEFSPFTDTYECSKCGYQVPCEELCSNFCPDCGADLRKDTNT